MTRTGGEKRRRSLIEEAIRCFGRDGYNGASLEVIASACGIRKQTLLYYFPNKDALLEACLAAAGDRVALALGEALTGKETYWDRAEAVIHAVFKLAEEWPEFPMFIREAGRLGPDAFDRFAGVLDPLRQGAIEFLQSGMDSGEIRKQDPALLLFTLYTAVVARSPRPACCTPSSEPTRAEPRCAAARRRFSSSSGRRCSRRKWRSRFAPSCWSVRGLDQSVCQRISWTWIGSSNPLSSIAPRSSNVKPLPLASSRIALEQ